MNKQINLKKTEDYIIFYVEYGHYGTRSSMVCWNSCRDACDWSFGYFFLWIVCRTRLFSLRYIFFMLLIFQLSLFSLVAISFLLVVGVPVAFASPVGWSQNKRLVLSRARLWFLLVVLVGILNSFIVLFYFLSFC